MNKITGSIFNAYFVCKRKLWFYSREISPFVGNDLLELGKMIHEESYKREKKEISLGNIKIDIVKKYGGNVIVAEVKKSSRAMKSARMQLLFYLYKLKQMGVSAEGELLVPKEKKREKVELTEEKEEEIRNVIEDIKRIISMPVPPEFKKSRYCNKCAYKDFCFS